MAAYEKFIEFMEKNGYELDDYDKTAQGQIIYEFCKENGIQIPQFKDNRKSLYKSRGYKVKDALKAHKERTGGEIYMSYVDLGDVPLKSPKTVSLARKLESKIIHKDAPRRTKLEHGLTRNNLIHAHFIFSGENPPPETVKIGSKEYPVNTVTLGHSDKWSKYSYDEQIERAVTYLYKPGNAAGLDGHKKQDLKYQAYLEWYLEQRELSKLTPNEIKKSKSRTAWNKNIKG